MHSGKREEVSKKAQRCSAAAGVRPYQATVDQIANEDTETDTGKMEAEAVMALLHEYPLRVGRRGPHFSGPSAGVTLQG